jgi:hypothetical protein
VGRAPLLSFLAAVDDGHLALSAGLVADHLGTFSPTEVAMTVIVGLASLVGIIGSSARRAAWEQGERR